VKEIMQINVLSSIWRHVIW